MAELRSCGEIALIYNDFDGSVVSQQSGEMFAGHAVGQAYQSFGLEESGWSCGEGTDATREPGGGPVATEANRDCVFAEETHLDLRLDFDRTPKHLIGSVVPLANRAHAYFRQFGIAT